LKFTPAQFRRDRGDRPDPVHLQQMAFTNQRVHEVRLDRCIDFATFSASREKLLHVALLKSDRVLG
jgi:hypothetical protein